MPNANASTQQTTQETVVAPKDDFQLASDANKNAETSETQPAETEVEATESENNSAESETEEIEENVSENESEQEEELAAGEKTNEEQTAGKKKGGVQKRIDKLTKRNSKLAQENEYWKSLAMKNANPGEQTQTPKAEPVVETSQKPSRENFETLEAYTEALTDWRVDQKLAAKDERSAKQKAEDAAKADAETLKTNHLSRVEKYQKDNPDFAEDMEDFKTAKIALNVQFAVMESEFGPELMHEFAKNPTALEKLNTMAPAAANREIGRLEAKFASKETTETETTTPAAPAKKITKAPAPITPVNSKAGHVKTSRDKLPYDEWVQVRRAEMKGR